MPLVATRYSVGRAADNDIVLTGAGVSRHHGILRKEGESFLISDLSSHNGVYVNGSKVQEAALRDKDQIRIGHYLIVYDEAAAGRTMSSFSEITAEEDYDELLAQLTSGVRTSLGRAEGKLPVWEEEKRRLGLLCDLGRALSTVHTLEEVAREAIQILLEVTKAERGAIFLLQEDESLVPALVSERTGLDDTLGPVVLSSTVAQRILSERKGVITADAGIDPRFAHGESVVLHGLRSMACAPLVGKGGNLGILYLENNHTIGAFTQEDLRLLCAVASQIALSVENAKLFEALKRANEDLEQQVQERTADLRQTELKLYRSEKIASLSRLVAGVAHEINSPLGALKSSLELLTVMLGRLATTPNRAPDETKLLHHLVRITHECVSAASRIMGVVRALSSYSRLEESSFKVANINEGLAAVEKLLDPSIRRQVKVVLNLGDVPSIPCHPAMLNEAFMNMLVNACQAIPQEGNVFIETRQDGDDVVVSMRDTGSGIPKEHLDKIFDPGFTTKGVGVGVGLGLALVYSVIQEHQGTIQVASEIDQGTTFTIRLPIKR